MIDIINDAERKKRTMEERLMKKDVVRRHVFI